MANEPDLNDLSPLEKISPYRIYPEPDESLLLNRDEIRKIIDFVVDLDMLTGIEMDERDHLETAVIEGAKAQLVKNEERYKARLKEKDDEWEAEINKILAGKVARQDPKLREEIAEKLYILVMKARFGKVRRKFADLPSETQGIWGEKADQILKFVEARHQQEIDKVVEEIFREIDRMIYDLACYDPELFDPAYLIKTTQSIISQWQAIKPRYTEKK